MVDHRYEAWRNLLLIVIALIVGDCLIRFSEIRIGIVSLFEFDKTLHHRFYPDLLALLIVFYVAKNAHGILIFLFDENYANQIKHHRGLLVSYCLLVASLVVSFALILKIGAFVKDGVSLVERASRLMSIALGPSLVLLLFDLLFAYT